MIHKSISKSLEKGIHKCAKYFAKKQLFPTIWLIYHEIEISKKTNQIYDDNL